MPGIVIMRENKEWLLPKIDPAGKSIPSIFNERVKMEPEATAFRYKHRGIYKTVTWRHYFQRVEHFCMGLLELGLQPADRVAIMGECCPEWIYASMAVQSAGAIDFGIHTSCSSTEVTNLLENAEPVFFIAQHQEYVDKLLPTLHLFPSLKNVIVIDSRGMFSYEHSKLVTYSHVEKMGKDRKARIKEDLSAHIQKTTSDSIAFIAYTAGTSNLPNGVMLSHHNIMSAFVEALIEYFPEIADHRQRLISHMSMSGMLERAFTIYFPLIYDAELHLGENVNSLGDTLFEVQPTYFHATPGFWKKMVSLVAVQIMSSSWLKRWSYRQAMNIGRHYLELKWENKTVPFVPKIFYWLARHLIFQPLLRNLGLKYVRYAVSVAPLSPVIQEVWQTWGIDLVNIYSPIEAGGLVTAQQTGLNRPGTVGKPTSSWNKISLAKDGEILVRGPGICRGYWRDENTTQEKIKNGWLYMGDIGRLDRDGNLWLLDKKQDIMRTAEGESIPPNLIETALKGSIYIHEAMVFANGREFPSALIEIDFDTVSEWARRNKVSYTGYTSLAAQSEIHELIREEVQKANQNLLESQRVKEFRIIPRQSGVGAGYTIQTRKIKRTHCYTMFKDLIEGMYDSAKN